MRSNRDFCFLLCRRHFTLLLFRAVALLASALLATVSVATAEPVPGYEYRAPRDEKDLRRWLENMVWYHGFTRDEIKAATGLSDGEISEAIAKYDIGDKARPELFPKDRLLMLPWPGGRVISDWGGEIERTRQRETKATVFTPWNTEDYVVLDMPEALWSQLGLVYLAHVHVPTIWTEQRIELEKLEWTRRDDGGLEIHRKMPNGLEYKALFLPFRGSIRMRITLVNGTKDDLTNLRVQNCVFLKGLQTGFQSEDRPRLVASNPYHAYGRADGKRWVISAWMPTAHIWANPKNPCFHSDPAFEDCPAGESRSIHGWLSFYEGGDIEEEFKRIDKTGWREDRWVNKPRWTEEADRYGP